MEQLREYLDHFEVSRDVQIVESPPPVLASAIARKLSNPEFLSELTLPWDEMQIDSKYDASTAQTLLGLLLRFRKWERSVDIPEASSAVSSKIFDWLPNALRHVSLRLQQLSIDHSKELLATELAPLLTLIAAVGSSFGSFPRSTAPQTPVKIACLLQALCLHPSADVPEIENLIQKSIQSFVRGCTFQNFKSCLDLYRSEISFSNSPRRCLAGAKSLATAVSSGTGWRRLQILDRIKTQLISSIVSALHATRNWQNNRTICAQLINTLGQLSRAATLTPADVTALLHLSPPTTSLEVSKKASLNDAPRNILESNDHQQISRVVTDADDLVWVSYYRLVVGLLSRHFATSMHCVEVVLSHVTALLRGVFSNAIDASDAPLGDGVLKRRAELMARLFELLAEHPSQIKKYVGVVILEYVALCLNTHAKWLGTRHMRNRKLRTVDIVAPLRRAVLPGVYALVQVISKYELQATYSALDGSGKAFFKDMFKEYKRDFKFTGLV
eukprot:c10832_g1_i1.p1 GENE.c10832_g1_i1~~c10832_g1_i1.p1  ORF type:complete len:584 (+),score=160.15 c10832_g1_i1:255-1754(+)